MKVLVAGGAGFIGSHLVESLLRRGDEVWILAFHNTDLSFFEQKPVKIIYGDLTSLDSLHELDKLSDIVEEVYNFVGMLGKWGVKEGEYWRINSTATANLLKVCSGFKNLKHFFHCSSAGVVGPVGKNLVDEAYIGKPSNIYEKTKLAGEKIALMYYKKYHLPVTVIRPEFVYGPRDKHVLGLVKAIKNGKFFVIGSGRNYLHPTYVEDLISAFEKCRGSNAILGQVYFVAGPGPVTVKELASIIARVLKVRDPIRLPLFLARVIAEIFELSASIFRIEPLFSRSRLNFFTQNRCFSIQKAQRDFGYSPKYNLENGMPKTISWYRKNNYL